LSLSRRRALVTGSSRGIGAEIAKLFASEGARVAVNYSASARDARSIVESIRKEGGDAIAVRGDVSDPSSVADLFATVKREFGGLDVLINNAGLSDSGIWKAGVEDASLDMWQRAFEVDVFGTFLCSQAAARLMKRGAVVNVSSTPALVGDTEGLVYASAKGAVLSMTRMLALMLAPRIRVNCMVFGSFKTGWTEWLNAKSLASYRRSIPLGRFGEPSDAARLALFLAGDGSSFITGQSIVIDGGEVPH
jgi:NAD(P)-dependent dehydrogenase (short-subunit alcohol dehydrogenase family)